MVSTNLTAIIVKKENEEADVLRRMTAFSLQTQADEAVAEEQRQEQAEKERADIQKLREEYEERVQQEVALQRHAEEKEEAEAVKRSDQARIDAALALHGGEQDGEADAVKAAYVKMAESRGAATVSKGICCPGCGACFNTPVDLRRHKPTCTPPSELKSAGNAAEVVSEATPAVGVAMVYTKTNTPCTILQVGFAAV